MLSQCLQTDCAVRAMRNTFPRQLLDKTNNVWLRNNYEGRSYAISSFFLPLLSLRSMYSPENIIIKRPQPVLFPYLEIEFHINKKSSKFTVFYAYKFLGKTQSDKVFLILIRISRIQFLIS